MFSSKIVNNLNKSSWIRAMFEEGERLRKIHGADKVFDFSIGNPEIEPPQAVTDTIIRLVKGKEPGKHWYMSNSGYSDVREKVAASLRKESGIPMTQNNVVMTCGAAGGLNIALKSLLNPGEEVIIFSPYFVEYLTYIDNYGGISVTVPTDRDTFQPDAGMLEKYITKSTKAMIINSPNNPTGVIYSNDTLKAISDLLEKKEREYGTSIYVLSDEPYNKIVYDGATVPPMLKIFKNAILVNSFSKSLALPGERIGYIAASSRIDSVETLVNAFTYCNRVLGFVNAPALFQKAIADNLDESIDIEWYQKRRDLMYNHLTDFGFSCVKPGGAFYLFPRSLEENDVDFIKRAVKYNLLLVPGSGFGRPGYFRLAYCYGMKTLENSLPAFEALAKEYR